MPAPELPDRIVGAAFKPKRTDLCIDRRKTAVPVVMADGLPACRSSSHARGMSALTGGTPVLRLKLERAVFGIDMDGLAFADFAFKDVYAERVENFFLDCALQRAGAVNGIVTFARDQFLGRIGKIERDLLLLEPFRQAAKLNFNDLPEIVFGEAIENDDLVDAI